ncbi:uncharacterized protein AB675_1849 [Cyphellophora attinorum]|uniref:BTB domain-containing protein n=1 Tax=Cyphellophora attinorum TaxID=1664694 RepID=A0A0N1P1W6_9EURO|nr:uncharacterized protein AB675_1849 [Phialophora attinorum]KPI42886.1 hypothetical protein AB675_1849 [Phialophora attinorum]
MLFGPSTIPQRQLLASGKYSDLVLQCKDAEIKVHCAYVNIASPVIEALYDKAIEAGSTSATPVVSLPDTDVRSLSGVLECLYTRQYSDLDYFFEVVALRSIDFARVLSADSQLTTFKSTEAPSIYKFGTPVYRRVEQDIKVYLCAKSLKIEYVAQTAHQNAETTLRQILRDSGAVAQAIRPLGLLFESTVSGEDNLRTTVVQICLEQRENCDANPQLRALLLKHESSIWTVILPPLQPGRFVRTFKCSTCSEQVTLRHLSSLGAAALAGGLSMGCPRCGKGTGLFDRAMQFTPVYDGLFNNMNPSPYGVSVNSGPKSSASRLDGNTTVTNPWTIGTEEGRSGGGGLSSNGPFKSSSGGLFGMNSGGPSGTNSGGPSGTNSNGPFGTNSGGLFGTNSGGPFGTRALGTPAQPLPQASGFNFGPSNTQKATTPAQASSQGSGFNFGPSNNQGATPAQPTSQANGFNFGSSNTQKASPALKQGSFLNAPAAAANRPVETSGPWPLIAPSASRATQPSFGFGAQSTTTVPNSVSEPFSGFKFGPLPSKRVAQKSATVEDGSEDGSV